MEVDAEPAALDAGPMGDTGRDATAVAMDAFVRDVPPDALASTDATYDAAPDAGTDAAVCPSGTTAGPTGCTATTPTAPCEVPGDLLHLEGAAWVFTGVTTIDSSRAEFVVRGVADPASMPGPTVNTLHAEVDLVVAPGEPRPFPDYFRLDVSTAGTDRSLEVGSFEGATRYPFSMYDGMLGLDLSSTGRGCNHSSGRFEIQRIALEGSVVREVLVSFDFFCELRGDRVSGCLHYAAP